jgi:hypothetical protein
MVKSVKNEHSIFASLYRNSDLSEAFDDQFGLLYHFEEFCTAKSLESTDKRWRNEANTWKLLRSLLKYSAVNTVGENSNHWMMIYQHFVRAFHIRATEN